MNLNTKLNLLRKYNYLDTSIADIESKLKVIEDNYLQKIMKINKKKELSCGHFYKQFPLENYKDNKEERIRLIKQMCNNNKRCALSIKHPYCRIKKKVRGVSISTQTNTRNRNISVPIRNNTVNTRNRNNTVNTRNRNNTVNTGNRNNTSIEVACGEIYKNYPANVYKNRILRKKMIHDICAQRSDCSRTHKAPSYCHKRVRR
jgi:hypothetical protein